MSYNYKITLTMLILIFILFSIKNSYSNDELELVWGHQFGSSNSDVARDVVGDDTGNIYIVGETEGTLGNAKYGKRDVYVAKFDSSSKILWINQFGRRLTKSGVGHVIRGLMKNSNIQKKVYPTIKVEQTKEKFL